MKLKLSILALLVTGVTGCNSTPQSGLEQSLGWGNYGSLSFETSSEGIVAQRYQVSKSPVGQITSIEEQGNQIHVIQTLEGALIKGVDSTGIMNYEGCMESVGEVDAAVNAYPSIVQFLLKQAAPQGPNSVSTSLPFTVSESANNAQIYIGEATSVEIEGESYPIGPMIELSAPWGHLAKSHLSMRQPLNFHILRLTMATKIRLISVVHGAKVWARWISLTKNLRESG